MKKYVIAIDGPAGVGKSVISKIIAKELGYVYVKTGDMFRAIAYNMIKKNVDINDAKKVSKELENIDLRFEFLNDMQISILNNVDITEKLNSIEVSNVVSIFSGYKVVRDKVLVFEKEVAKNNNIVMEGRDIGTTVFPNADVKIYLTASVETRANRRYKQNLEKGIKSSIEEIKSNIEFRDKLDKEKEFGALKTAEDAIVIENDNKTIEEVSKEMLDYIKMKLGE